MSPLKRIADPSQIVAAILYRVADATFSTGVTLQPTAVSQSPEVVKTAGATVPSSFSAPFQKTR
ncbi:MAG TPA: hypothetical protein VJU79_04540 [Candidatus Dormibacteraeota bacterium]|nr:hypothetical protein [Candidatus Dormibacteraeota bacterium]